MITEKFLNGERVQELWAKIKTALSGKQDALSPDDTITLQDGNIGVALPSKALTRAEYDALTDAQKKAPVLYAVTDDAPGGPQGLGGNPLGTIISYMGVTAPNGYLVCDGAEYSVSDYPELASFFESQFGAKNHFGGDGTATFAVPDMRNLFLRGFHGEAEEKLSGEIGAKQSGTEIPNIAPMFVGDSKSAIGQFSDNKQNILVENEDTFINPVHHLARCFGTSPFEAISDWPDFAAKNPGMRYTSRPVNMAVLYCIKTV